MVSSPRTKAATNNCVLRRPATQALYSRRAIPGAEDSDTNSVTLGVKFTVTRNGYVSGVRFYRSAHASAHAIDLWQGSRKLAGGDVPAVGTGWIDALFSRPVRVIHGTTYVASYSASRYVARNHGFDKARAAHDISAPKGAGVYHYGATPAAPSRNYQNSEYYVSPLFKPGATPTPTPRPTTPTPTTPAPTQYSCSVPSNSACGPYSDSSIPMSNGYNTYVSNQHVGPQTGTTELVQANSPSDWQVVADARPYGYTGVQTFPDVQQLTNNWCGSVTNWSTCANPADTPVSALSALRVNYAEQSPRDDRSIYEFAADVWIDNYGADVMFWVDTHGRCNEGAFGGTVLGHAVLDGQNWTVHRYGNAGAEIIFVLDGTSGEGSCAQQPSGMIDVKAGLDWLTAKGFVTGKTLLSQLNTGWEITSAANTRFRVTDYSITAR
jgi:hypothetical protein